MDEAVKDFARKYKEEFTDSQVTDAYNELIEKCCFLDI